MSLALSLVLLSFMWLARQHVGPVELHFSHMSRVQERNVGTVLLMNESTEERWHERLLIVADPPPRIRA